MVYYKEFSKQIKEKYPQYKDVDDMKLAKAMVEKYPVYDVSFENTDKNGIDVTPSSFFKRFAAGVTTPLGMALYKQNPVDAYKTIRQLQENSPSMKGLSAVTDAGTTLLLPEIKAFKGASLLPRIGNYALTGAEQGSVIGGLEGLKENGLSGLTKGALQGAAIGSAVGGGLPLAGNAILQSTKLLPMTGNLAARTIGRIKPETLRQAVRPNSQALDLTENQAQNLLMNTTERVRNAYDNLLTKAGEKVSEATKNLPKNYFVPKETLQKTLDNVYGSYSVSGDKALNVARNEAGKVYNDINNLIENASNVQDVVPARELKDILNNISAKTQWDKPGAQLQNEILERVYGDYNSRLSKLSPELAQANKEYSALKNFEKNEGLRRILRKGDNIDTASSALRNYNSTVTKGNTGRNIQELENTLVENGEQPFLNDIDDVNAAMDLLNQRTTGDSWLANIATQATRPVLKGVREFNRRNLPQVFNKIGQKMPKFLTPLLYGTPTLYGHISND